MGDTVSISGGWYYCSCLVVLLQLSGCTIAAVWLNYCSCLVVLFQLSGCTIAAVWLKLNTVFLA